MHARAEATRNTAICSSSIFSWVGPGELVYLGRKQYFHLFPKTNKPRRTELMVHYKYKSDRGFFYKITITVMGKKGLGQILCCVYCVTYIDILCRYVQVKLIARFRGVSLEQN